MCGLDQSREQKWKKTENVDKKFIMSSFKLEVLTFPYKWILHHVFFTINFLNNIYAFALLPADVPPKSWSQVKFGEYLMVIVLPYPVCKVNTCVYICICIYAYTVYTHTHTRTHTAFSLLPTCFFYYLEKFFVRWSFLLSYLNNHIISVPHLSQFFYHLKSLPNPHLQ